MYISTLMVIGLFLVGVGVALYERGVRKGIQQANAIHCAIISEFIAQARKDAERVGEK